MPTRVLAQRPGVSDTTTARLISSQFGLSMLASHILVSRGVASIDEAERFLSPKMQDLHNPFLLSHLSTAVSRILSAIENNEHVFVLGDYDCDGIAASSIMCLFFSRRGVQAHCRLPNRFSEGYGLKPHMVQEAFQAGATLIVTVDNGIASHKEAELAKSLDIDFIVLDHHECPQEMPDAYAIVNPKKPGETYPFRELCAASIVYKVVCASGLLSEAEHNEYLALAALATIADIVDLDGENRTIATLGLQCLNGHANKGVAALASNSNIDAGKIDESAISFRIAPLINAAGRLTTADLGAKLLMSSSEIEAGLIAKELAKLNEERQHIEEKLFEDAKVYVETHNLVSDAIMFVALEGAHEGVIGIVAGRLAEAYGRPCVIASIIDGQARASARSARGIDLYEALCAADGLYNSFGGHSAAAGFSSAREDFDNIKQVVNTYAWQSPSKAPLMEAYDVETELACLSMDTALELGKLGPFGPKNPRPVFKIESVQTSGARLIGRNKDHVSLSFVKAPANLPAVAFKMGSDFSALSSTRKLDAAFSLSINTYKAKSTLQLELKAFAEHFACPQAFYESQLRYFNTNLGNWSLYEPDVYAQGELEDLIEPGSGNVHILYSKMALERVVRYCIANNLALSINYGIFEEDSQGKPSVVYVLANPIGDSLPDARIIVLDKPFYFGYEERFYGEDGGDIVFCRCQGSDPAYGIDRDFVALVYKRLNYLESLSNVTDSFIRLLNNFGEIRVDYFKLFLCLEMLAELEILEFNSTDDFLYVKFIPQNTQKDLNLSSIMIELRRLLKKAYA
ncbi:MAG: single-stranded-DNA-specific exonuclease RecJ [Eubacteriaceae bacterium]|nr:single-stranded-DNA-specific exonuclease RecJ [Eubacteriaceae bacterium]